MSRAVLCARSVLLPLASFPSIEVKYSRDVFRLIYIASSEGLKCTARSVSNETIHGQPKSRLLQGFVESSIVRIATRLIRFTSFPFVTARKQDAHGSSNAVAECILRHTSAYVIGVQGSFCYYYSTCSRRVPVCVIKLLRG